MAGWKVAKWRINVKNKLVEGFGGKCNKCGYSKCNRCLDLHHIDPSEKSFGFGRAMANPKKWDVLVEEARKCALLCSNCHGELHDGLWKLEDIDLVSFKGELTQYKKDTPTGKCPVCDKDVFMNNICCDAKCAAKRANKIEWPEKEELRILLENNPKTKIAKMLGVSEAAVRKRARKYGLMP